jgi:Flp pilus assembly protein TadG
MINAQISMHVVKLTCRLRRFFSRSQGGMTIEFIMWVPVLVGVISLTVQTSMIFTTQSNYWSVARDTARIVARHAMTETVAETYAISQASTNMVTPTVDVTIGNSSVTVLISAPASSVTPFSGIGILSGVTIGATVTQALEPI